VQGVYRLLGSAPDLLESFVAAPGPMGWRYFGRVRRSDTGEELRVVDLVVDLQWRVVRFRSLGSDGAEVVAVPAEDGLDAFVLEGGTERTLAFPHAQGIWSWSPSSALVAARWLGDRPMGSFTAVVADSPSLEPFGATVAVHRAARDRLDFTVGDRLIRVAMEGDEPVSSDGWFERVSAGTA
jgi:hypothetical protein